LKTFLLKQGCPLSLGLLSKNHEQLSKEINKRYTNTKRGKLSPCEDDSLYRKTYKILQRLLELNKFSKVYRNLKNKPLHLQPTDSQQKHQKPTVEKG
jgi:hypothetical protein